MNRSICSFRERTQAHQPRPAPNQRDRWPRTVTSCYCRLADVVLRARIRHAMSQRLGVGRYDVRHAMVVRWMVAVRSPPCGRARRHFAEPPAPTVPAAGHRLRSTDGSAFMRAPLPASPSSCKARACSSESGSARWADGEVIGPGTCFRTPAPRSDFHWSRMSWFWRLNSSLLCAHHRVQLAFGLREERRAQALQSTPA